MIPEFFSSLFNFFCSFLSFFNLVYKSLMSNDIQKEVNEVIENFNVITFNSQQLSQAKVRFNEDISLGILIPPSDPDFPFDVALLHLLLMVPKSYPQSKPEIMVLNDDIPRGYSYNVEYGFKVLTGQIKDDELELQSSENTLASFLKTIDINLEKLLKMEKREVKIKIVKQRKNKSKKSEEDREKEDTRASKKGNSKNENSKAVAAPNEFKDTQIKLLKARFNVKTVKEGSTYKTSLRLSDPLHFEFDSNSNISIPTLHIKMVIPQDYGRDQGRNRVKMEIDFGHPENLKLLTNIKSPEIKNIVKDLLMNIGKNFDQYTSKNNNAKISEYLNFLVGNVPKLIGQKADFAQFIETLAL